MSFQTSPYEGVGATPIPAMPEQPAGFVPSPGAPPAAPTLVTVMGPQVIRRERWLGLPDDSDYAGFKFRAWLNYPTWVGQQLGADDQDEARVALCMIVLEHNGWRDEAGQPYPPAADPALWERVPSDLASLVLVMIGREKGQLPNSLKPNKRR